MSKVIGIDLGTTNSAVAVVEAGKPKVIHSAEGRNIIPSVVDPQKHIVGDVAKRQMIVNPKTTIFSVKRLMGRKFKDAEVQRDIKWLPYEIKEGRDGMAVVSLEGKDYTPQEISAMILSKIKADAEAYLGGKVDQAVITVPAYFDDSQRQATKQAGEIAGLKVERIINEPTAAALAYGLDKSHAHTIAVYDLGGGTFDISILELGEGVFEVKATNGNTHLGGDDFDSKLVEYIIGEFKKESGVDVEKDKQALQRVRDAAEKAKIELSSTAETEISIPYVTADQTGPKHLQLKLSRAKLESIVGELVEKTFEPVSKCLKDAKIDVKKVDEVILVGGMTRMPLVVSKVKEFFGKEPHKGLNPDEVVAIGAAVQGAVLTGEMKEMVLLDVTPLTLGIETLGGVATALIPRNTTVPTSKNEVFSTAADNQTSVEINVVQGERPMAQDDIDANGILNVKAKDKATSKEQSIKITGSTGLTDEEIKRMTQEAEEHAAEDTKKKDEIETRNQADTLVYQAEKSLKDAGDKVPADVKSEVEEKIKALKGIESTAPIEEVKQKTEELSAVLSKIGESMYQQKGPEATKGTEGTESAECRWRNEN
ncbi:MAG: Chaperone protein DnaK [Candidatus Curtissbacteria bacterium GW2011_GWA1_40_24]|uniref:Chaperone protein DnaK n=1 Tax=Candidatus Curtissbacteria bacterium GW2011_GWA1_40_24 TaxID=1618406 RepID=A0A0G0U791_9BACT|nr:MAG: Chaperone protein DnaK [Candidatus Curtissbacteria bacterium GW2011_GWA1_40_24]